jgi:pullulanase-type alpha-1,6-glucosidase
MPPWGDLTLARAHWVSPETIAWSLPTGVGRCTLHHHPAGSLSLDASGVKGGEAIPLAVDPAGLSRPLLERFPHLRGYTAVRLDLERPRLQALVREQLAVSAASPSGELLEATGLQIPGVLDALFSYDGPLGIAWDGTTPTLRLWAPTARSVALHLFSDAHSATAAATLAMGPDAAPGVWVARGDATWAGCFYLYEVEVFVPATGRIERNLVTDPYSLSLSTNSQRSQLVDLDDPRLKPPGWEALRKPSLDAPEDIVVYELHVRDFSISDLSVPEALRGTFQAFTQRTSRGMAHLRRLARAGLTHVHLLPAFDVASIEEERSARLELDRTHLAGEPPDSPAQQAAVGAIRRHDGYNWGYDPYHYLAPEGGYATDPAGAQRILEFREMVQALAAAGLRVVMDVVFNHTHAAGQAEGSVLDRIVPGYYHRLDADGRITTSSCCPNTATEHGMMEKLMVDALLTWARAYKVDAFRFDLMGHHMVANIRRVRDALRSLTPEKDGVDGQSLYLYGEGWDFGEVAHGARGPNASQHNVAGLGIGTFSDRLRDAARGGGPFSGLQEQGFATGLYYLRNGITSGDAEEQKARLLYLADLVRINLTGCLADYVFVDRTGHRVRCADFSFNGQPAGFARDPQECVTYLEAHDNETFFDALQLKLPAALPMDTRVRLHNLGLSLVLLGQGIPFVHAGQDLLRSKSLDRNSYDSGDWFNRLDFTYATNNWGVGLPPAWDNERHWPVMGPLLASPQLAPAREHILRAAHHFREMLRIRKSSRLLRLRTSAEVQACLRFLGTGPDQVPGVVAMLLTPSGAVAAEPRRRPHRLVVVFNATPETQSLNEPSLRRQPFHLHFVQLLSRDPVVRRCRYAFRAGVFTVPPWTTAVFLGEIR